jgi:TPR repeat protein
MHAYARGVHQDYEHALRLFKHTFEHHAHGPAAYYLGIMHANAQGVMLNYPLARYYLLKAVESGDIRTLKMANATYAQLNGFMEYASGMAESRSKAMRMEMGKSAGSSEAALYGVPRLPT